MSGAAPTYDVSAPSPPAVLLSSSSSTPSRSPSSSSSHYPPSAIFSQSDRCSRYAPSLRSIYDLCGSSSLAYPKLERLCVHFGPRLSGSSALEAAIDWLISELRAQGGMDAVWEQSVTVPCWQRGEAHAFVVSPTRPEQQPDESSDAPSLPATSPSAFHSPVFCPSLHRPLHVLSIGLSCSTPPSGLTARLVEFSSFAQLASAVSSDPDAVRGHIVLFNRPFTSYDDAVQYRSRGAMTAEPHGALAVLVRSVTPASLATPHTGNMRPSALPAVCVTVEDAELLSRLLRLSVDGVSVHLFSSSRLLADRASRNVCAELRGRELPDEYVLVGAHIDSWDVGQGAHDDGQGVVAAWEAVRLLASQPGLRPRRSIRLVCFTDEECRSSGAKAYLQQTRVEVQAGRLVAAIETDVGCGPPIGFGFTGQAAAKQQLADIAAALRPFGWDAVCDDGRGVDIAPLIDCGVPGLLLRMEQQWWNKDYFHYHHTHADTIDKIDPHTLTTHVQLLAMMAWLLAEVEDRLPSGVADGQSAAGDER